MAKATFKLPDGTDVTIDGSPEEIQRILAVYGSQRPDSPTSQPPALPARKKPKRRAAKTRDSSAGAGDGGAGPNLNGIVRALKDWDKFDSVEKNILDKASQVDRTLLPIYVSQKLTQEARGLTSGDISKVTRELGVLVAAPNVSKTLAGTAQRYVHGDVVRRSGQPVRYLLTRRGIQYIEAVVDGKQDAL